ncbi:MAG: methylornithine synthase PylB [Deltaproteobacteria bacterium]|jgi:methylornithine synthase|nr:methylornithine synthase PylB [Deltaproteobacteria bacterium]
MDQVSMTPQERIEKAIIDSYDYGSIDPEDLAFILSLTPKDAKLAEMVFYAARIKRHSLFKNKIALYGFVYLSTHCHNNCSFCNYRASNHALKRYRKSPSEILEVASELTESGVHLVDLTLGEDEHYLNGKGFEQLLKIIDTISSRYRAPVMISPGVLDLSRLKEAKAAGASWYALYQETFNRTLFRELRPDQNFSKRLHAKRLARDVGFHTEDGILVGVGASTADLVYSVLSMTQGDNLQMRAMAYVPVPGGLAPDPNVDPSWQELLVIACVRLISPHAFIPASLDVDGLAGLGRRLNAGANVVTSIVPPSKGFCGVASMDLDIDNSNRSVKTVTETLREFDLEPFNHESYSNSYHVYYRREAIEANKFFSRDLPPNEVKMRRKFRTVFKNAFSGLKSFDFYYETMISAKQILSEFESEIYDDDNQDDN